MKWVILHRKAAADAMGHFSHFCSQSRCVVWRDFVALSKWALTELSPDVKDGATCPTRFLTGLRLKAVSMADVLVRPPETRWAL